MLEKIEGGRRRGWQKIWWSDGITKAMNMRLSRLWELVMNREAWSATVHGVVKSQTPLSDWTELNKIRQWRELSFSTGHRPKSWFNFPWPGMLPEDSKISGLLVKQSLPLSVILGNQGSAMTEMGPEIDASQSRKVIKHTTHTHTHTHTHTRVPSQSTVLWPKASLSRLLTF